VLLAITNTLICVLKGMHNDEVLTKEISCYDTKTEVSNTVTTKTAFFLFVVTLDLVESYRPIGDKYCLIIDPILPSEYLAVSSTLHSATYQKTAIMNIFRVKHIFIMLDSAHCLNL
jgi:hypothetical protein